MIESGTAGTAARVHAAALRADGAPEASEWFLRVAEHQEATGRRLSALSPAWAILHEVVPTGVDGLIDHVVIGSGGAYIVVTRPCDGELSLENQSLVCAGVSLDHDLEQVRRAAVALTSQLGTPVVPVLALAVKALPFGAPLLSGGVMVCTVDRLVNTITKATHTDLAADRVVELVEAAAPLLRDPSSVVRPDRRAQSRGERTSASRLPSMEKADPPMSSTTGAPQRRRRFFRFRQKFTV